MKGFYGEAAQNSERGGQADDAMGGVEIAQITAWRLLNKAAGAKLLKLHWVLERLFACLTEDRCLRKDGQRLIAASLSVLYSATVCHLLLWRLAQK
ncbi:MAG: hypothetical protein WAT67_08845 [Candidatus Contendobacter sp.]